jgi:hypothetical protein
MFLLMVAILLGVGICWTLGDVCITMAAMLWNWMWMCINIAGVSWSYFLVALKHLLCSECTLSNSAASPGKASNSQSPVVFHVTPPPYFNQEQRTHHVQMDFNDADTTRFMKVLEKCVRKVVSENTHILQNKRLEDVMHGFNEECTVVTQAFFSEHKDARGMVMTIARENVTKNVVAIFDAFLLVLDKIQCTDNDCKSNRDVSETQVEMLKDKLVATLLRAQGDVWWSLPAVMIKTAIDVVIARVVIPWVAATFGRGPAQHPNPNPNQDPQPQAMNDLGMVLMQQHQEMIRLQHQERQERIRLQHYGLISNFISDKGGMTVLLTFLGGGAAVTILLDHIKDFFLSIFKAWFGLQLDYPGKWNKPQEVVELMITELAPHYNCTRMEDVQKFHDTMRLSGCYGNVSVGDETWERCVGLVKQVFGLSKDLRSPQVTLNSDSSSSAAAPAAYISSISQPLISLFSAATSPKNGQASSLLMHDIDLNSIGPETVKQSQAAESSMQEHQQMYEFVDKSMRSFAAYSATKLQKDEEALLQLCDVTGRVFAPHMCETVRPLKANESLYRDQKVLTFLKVGMIYEMLQEKAWDGLQSHARSLIDRTVLSLVDIQHIRHPVSEEHVKEFRVRRSELTGMEVDEQYQPLIDYRPRAMN